MTFTADIIALCLGVVEGDSLAVLLLADFLEEKGEYVPALYKRGSGSYYYWTDNIWGYKGPDSVPTEVFHYLVVEDDLDIPTVYYSSERAAYLALAEAVAESVSSNI